MRQPSDDTPAILAVWTRELDNVDSIGRLKTARQVRDALGTCGSVRNARLLNCFEAPGRIRAIAATVRAFLAGLLALRPLPMQCALFTGSATVGDPLRHAVDADVVYADTIRALPWLRRLRKRAPAVRIVVDLDDMMSRRYAHLRARRLPLALGYLEKSLPRLLVRLLQAPIVARVVLGYERAALARAEQEVMALADVTVLVNEREAFLLQEAAAQSGRTVRARVVAIPPAAAPVAPRPPGAAIGVDTAWRAVFVGTDGLVQNRLTIAYLLSLWQRHELALPLVVYGRQRSAWPAIANVVFQGYVADIADAYTPGSIMVCPAFLSGGIKTKTLEGFAHRVPVIGNDATFEGLPLRDYPLVINAEDALVALLRDPSRRRADLARAVEVGFDYVVDQHSKRRFDARWREAVLGRGASLGSTAAATLSPELVSGT